MTGASDVFTWINKQGVRNSAGFEVQSIDRFTIQYRESKRFVNLHVEPGISAGRPSINLSARAFDRWANSSVPNTPAEQERMRGNFIAAMEFQGITVDS